MNCGMRVRLHSIPDAVSADLARLGELWSEGLERHGGPFLGGASFSAVDAFFAPVAFRIRSYGLPISGTGLAYAERLLVVPGMREWDAAAIAEPWRDPEHDEQAVANGTLIADLRVPA